MATLTAYPDPDPTTSTSDSRIKADAVGAQDSWANIRATATGDVTEGASPSQPAYWTLYTSATCPDGWLTIGRGMTTFDTSSIGGTSTALAGS